METTRNLALSYADDGDFERAQAMLERTFLLVQELNIQPKTSFITEKGWIYSQMGQSSKSWKY